MGAVGATRYNAGRKGGFFPACQGGSNCILIESFPGSSPLSPRGFVFSCKESGVAAPPHAFVLPIMHTKWPSGCKPDEPDCILVEMVIDGTLNHDTFDG